MWDRYVLLGLVAAQPTHGYAIRAAVHERLGDSWRLNNGHVYRLLTQLEHEGLIAGRDERIGKRPPRIVYAITAPGREALRRWLTEVPSCSSPARVDFGLRFVFIDLLRREFGAETLLEIVDGHIRRSRERIAALMDRRGTACADGSPGHIVVESAILHAESDVRVLEMCRTYLRRGDGAVDGAGAKPRLTPPPPKAKRGLLRGSRRLRTA
jgi:DNA-binding PadR family transcriptional regulator